jgi:hypothetical protein
VTIYERNDEITIALLREACEPTTEAFRDQPGLEDYRAIRTLGRVLTCDAPTPARPPKTPQPPRPPRGGRRRIAVVAAPAAAVLAAAIVLAITLLGTSSSALAQKFPVFASASSQPARAALGVFREANVTVGASRAFHTPAGTGYVTATADHKQLCVAAPAASAVELNAFIEAKAPSDASHLRYVGGCATMSEAERKGVVLMMPAAHRRVELVVVLPADASTPTVRFADGKTTTLDTKDGTAATIMRGPAVLKYEVKGIRVSTAVGANTAKPATVVAPRER